MTLKEFDSVHDLLKAMVEKSGNWISVDDPPRIGFYQEGLSNGIHYLISLGTIRSPWGKTGRSPNREWEKNSCLRTLMRTPSGRQKIAAMISTGDHCLEFMD